MAQLRRHERRLPARLHVLQLDRTERQEQRRPLGELLPRCLPGPPAPDLLHQSLLLRLEH